MQGMSFYTTLEIFTNPKDLEFTVGQDPKSKKFGFGIFRGRGHRYKPMLTSEPFAETLDELIEKIKEVLEVAVRTAGTKFDDKSTIIAQVLNPDSVPIGQMNVMNQDLIDRILETLKRERKASTCEMFVAEC